MCICVRVCTSFFFLCRQILIILIYEWNIVCIRQKKEQKFYVKSEKKERKPDCELIIDRERVIELFNKIE